MFKHELIRALVTHYARQAGYGGPIRVTTRREHFDRICRRRGGAMDVSERTAFAVTLHGRIPIVWVSPDRHRSMRTLSDTAAHEAVHVARGPDFPCQTKRGAEAKPFEAEVKRLLRGSE